MKASILAFLASAAAVCHAQIIVTPIVTPVAPTTSAVTYKTLRCSTYYGSSKVTPIRRNTYEYTTKYGQTIYPYITVNSTRSVSTCYSSYGSESTATAGVNVNIAAVVTRFPTAVVCTKQVSIIRATYVTSPTSTYTRTVTAYPTTDPQGLQYAIYANSEGPYTDPTYSTFEPKVFTNSTPYYFSTSTVLGGFSGNAADDDFTQFYNSAIAFNTTSFAINHRWWLKAPATGTYNVTIPLANDIALLWTGVSAYSNYSRATAVQAVTTDDATQTTYSFEATAGLVLPMRLIYAQTAGLYALTFRLTAPDGTVLLGADTAASPAVVQYSCSGYAGPAPPFPEFGVEQYGYAYTGL